MNTSTRRAIDQLRAADPARDWRPSQGLSANQTLDTVLRRSLLGKDEAAVSPLGDVKSRTSRQWLAPGLAAVAVVLVVLGTLTIGRMRTSSPQPTVQPQLFGATSGALADDPNYKATLARLDQILASAAKLPGSIGVATSPEPPLAGPPSVEGSSPYEINRIAWATGPGSVADAIAFFKAHLPRWATSYSLPGPSTNASAEIFFLDTATTAHQRPALDITVTEHGRGVAIRLAAGAIWNPSRPRGEFAVGITSVDVTVVRPGTAPTVHRTLVGTAAEQIAKAFNALPTTGGSWGPRECGLLRHLDFVDTLVFHTDAGTITAENKLLYFCSTLVVEVKGVNTVTLAGDLDATLLRLLGLPASYGGY